MKVNRALVLHLGIVVEETFHPIAGRRFTRPGTQLLHDAIDGDELDFEWIAYQHFIKQPFAHRVIVEIDESRDDRHAASIVTLRTFADEGANLRRASHCDDPATFDGEGFSPGLVRREREYSGIGNDEVSVPQ